MMHRKVLFCSVHDDGSHSGPLQWSSLRPKDLSLCYVTLNHSLGIMSNPLDRMDSMIDSRSMELSLAHQVSLVEVAWELREV